MNPYDGLHIGVRPHDFSAGDDARNCGEFHHEAALRTQRLAVGEPMSRRYTESMYTSKIVGFLVLMGLAGCTADASVPGPTIASDPHAEASRVYQRRCATCHGASGKGDGAVAAVLQPKPRDYGDPQWQLQVSDDDLALAIVKGGAAVGKSHLMPDHPDLAGRPEVVAALVATIRSFARAPALGDAVRSTHRGPDHVPPVIHVQNP
jgi:mono/diheme cytochrome c family protein